MVDKAMELRYFGGIFGGNIKPTPFLSLTLKMLQIQPEKDIVIEFIKNEEFKYGLIKLIDWLSHCSSIFDHTDMFEL